MNFNSIYKITIGEFLSNRDNHINKIVDEMCETNTFYRLSVFLNQINYDLDINDLDRLDLLFSCNLHLKNKSSIIQELDCIHDEVLNKLLDYKTDQKGFIYDKFEGLVYHDILYLTISYDSSRTKINRIFSFLFNRNTLIKIFYMFIVGFLMRIVVNYMYDVDVFKEYIDFIYLSCFGFVVSFSSFFYNVPSISKNVFSIQLIKKAFILYIQDLSYKSGKVVYGAEFGGETSSVKHTDVNMLTQDNPNRRNRRSSAGVGGLYAGEGKVSHTKSAALSGLYGGKEKTTSRKSAGLLGLYGGEKTIHPKSVGVGGLYDSGERLEGKNRRHVHKSRKSVPKTLPIHENLSEKDRNSIYELGGKNKSVSSVKELDSRSIYELQGEGMYGYSRNGYTAYRPQPVELDSRPKMPENVQSPESYNKFRDIEKVNLSEKISENTKVGQERKVSSKSKNSYANSNISESTLLGEIDTQSDTRSEKTRKKGYSKGYVEGFQRGYAAPKPGIAEKFVGGVLDRLWK